MFRDGSCLCATENGQSQAETCRQVLPTSRHRDSQNSVEPSRLCFFMMTFDEFQASASKYNRCIWRTLLWFVLATVACFGLLALFVEPLSDFYVRTFGEPAAGRLTALSVVTPLLILIGSVWYSERRLLRDARSKCPHCGKQILSMNHVVIATRNCPHCGRRVLQEPRDGQH